MRVLGKQRADERPGQGTSYCYIYVWALYAYVRYRSQNLKSCTHDIWKTPDPNITIFYLFKLT